MSLIFLGTGEGGRVGTSKGKDLVRESDPSTKHDSATSRSKTIFITDALLLWTLLSSGHVFLRINCINSSLNLDKTQPKANGNSFKCI